MSPSLYPAHCRERSAESCGSSHATPASPSGRTGFSSRGSRHVLECSSAHWESCRPSRVPGMTPASGPAQRIGDSASLSRLYLSKFPVSIDAGESRFGPAIFTDSLSERSRWIENPSFASSWRITVYSELTGRLTTRNRLIPSGEIPAGKSASVYQSSRFHLDESPPIRSPDPWPVSIAPGRFDHDSSQVCVT